MNPTLFECSGRVGTLYLKNYYHDKKKTSRFKLSATGTSFLKFVVIVKQCSYFTIDCVDPALDEETAAAEELQGQYDLDLDTSSLSTFLELCLGDGKEPIEYGDIVRRTSERCEEYEIDIGYESKEHTNLFAVYLYLSFELRTS